jgi:hypothetical protein
MISAVATALRAVYDIRSAINTNVPQVRGYNDVICG